ncbi:MAG: hypothetical protein U0531_13460 [Dehalococcoidia bacterium]
MSIDVGGTSADVCLVRDGGQVTTEGAVSAYPIHDYRWWISTPSAPAKAASRA